MISRIEVPRGTPYTVPGKSRSRWICPEFFVPVGGEELGRVTDGDPADRQDRAWFQARVDVEHAVDPQFGARAGHRTWEQRGARGDEDLILDRGAVHVACGPISTASPISAGWSARPRTRAFSITTLFSPRRTSPFSAVSTAPCNTLQPSPRTTAPHRALPTARRRRTPARPVSGRGVRAASAVTLSSCITSSLVIVGRRPEGIHSPGPHCPGGRRPVRPSTSNGGRFGREDEGSGVASGGSASLQDGH